MPRHVAFTLVVTIVLALSIVFRVWGQEEELRGLDVKAVSLCRTGLDNARAPCLILSKHEEAHVIYVAVFTADGTEMRTIIRHDNASGKQVVVWPKAGADSSTAHSPHGR